MRLIVTGGGTGGHVYPALEVGRLAAEHGAELRYFGSLRGQEKAGCERERIPFVGFASEPLWSMKTPAGWRALLRMQRARAAARTALRTSPPDVIFSTGGYSAGPVVAAARDLGIPYIVHSADSFPPRSSSMFAKEAFAFTTVFRSTSEFFTERKVERTGQPIRKELRIAAEKARKKAKGSNPLVLVIGGSQGSEFLNQMMPKVATLRGQEVRIRHVTGPAHLEKTRARLAEAQVTGAYELLPYLETAAMVESLSEAAVVICRGGGTLAEIAMFGTPSIIFPLPSSANDHQLHNAREFEKMEAATVLWQPDDRRQPVKVGTPEAVAEAIQDWLGNQPKRDQARHNLKDWDIPDATDRIVKLIQSAAMK